MFETEGYTVLRRFVPRDLCGFLSANYRLLVDNGQMTYDDGQVERGYAAYGLAISETLLGMFTEPLSRALEIPLLPSYSYTRFYLKGAERPHWRPPLADDWQAQVFLHFVQRDGPYANFKYDTRPRLGASIESRTFRQPPPKMRLGEAS